MKPLGDAKCRKERGTGGSGESRTHSVRDVEEALDQAASGFTRGSGTRRVQRRWMVLDRQRIERGAYVQKTVAEPVWLKTTSTIARDFAMISSVAAIMEGLNSECRHRAVLSASMPRSSSSSGPTRTVNHRWRLRSLRTRSTERREADRHSIRAANRGLGMPCIIGFQTGQPTVAC